jgi:hypothetical protein
MHYLLTNCEKCSERADAFTDGNLMIYDDAIRHLFYFVSMTRQISDQSMLMHLAKNLSCHAKLYVRNGYRVAGEVGASDGRFVVGEYVGSGAMIAGLVLGKSNTALSWAQPNHPSIRSR